jgi:hypothetical protein
MLNQMIEHRGYMLRLAHPERVEGYDIRISDLLTIDLEDLPAGGTLDVTVVLRADAGNEYVYYGAGLYRNWWYNIDLNAPLVRHGGVAKQDVIDYVDAVVRRHNLEEKRVIRPDADPQKIFMDESSGYYTGCAGFEAYLTKAEILALTKDPDVKVIYSVRDDRALRLAAHGGPGSIQEEDHNFYPSRG